MITAADLIPAYKVGDRVTSGHDGQGVARRGRARVWTVFVDDTNQTPIRDPEPAYGLVDRHGNVRYAYESDLLQAPPEEG